MLNGASHYIVRFGTSVVVVKWEGLRAEMESVSVKWDGGLRPQLAYHVQ